MNKVIADKEQLLKFFKKLYADEIQLNFDEYFYIENTGTNIFGLAFPKNKYYYINGSLDMSECQSFFDWLVTKEKKRVLIKNDDLDALRKEKIKDILYIETTSDSYIIKTINREYVFTLEDYDKSETNFDFKYSVDIPKTEIEKSVLVSFLDNGAINFTNGELLFECALKNIKNIFKKEAVYRLYAGDKIDGTRIIMFEAKGTLCTLRQFFKVI